MAYKKHVRTTSTEIKRRSYDGNWAYSRGDRMSAEVLDCCVEVITCNDCGDRQVCPQWLELLGYDDD